MKKLADIKKLLSSAVPFLLFCMAFSNVVVSCCVYRSTRPKFVYSHSEVTNVVSHVVTNYVVGSNSYIPTNFQSAVSNPFRSQSSPTVTRSAYQSFVVAGRRGFRWYGRDYFEGDVCSLGLVLRVFPDKVFFHNGDRLENTESPLPSRPVFSPSRLSLNVGKGKFQDADYNNNP